MVGSAESITRLNRLTALKTALWTERATFDQHYRELASFTRPRRSRFTWTDKNRGDKRNQDIIDETASFAMRTLQSGMHAGLTSPARPWMRLSTPDPELADFKPVKEWLHETTMRMLVVMLESNLYNVLPIVYGDMGLFATAAMSVFDDQKDTFRCYSYPVGSFAFGLDKRGMPNIFAREFSMSIDALVGEFGVERLSQTAKNLWNRHQLTVQVPVTWMVVPNDRPDSLALEADRRLPYVSIYFETQGNNGQTLREGGFEEFPLMCPRWDVTGEDTYGTDCPGMMSLPATKQLQAMQKKLGQAIAKGIDPSLVGPTVLRSQQVSLLPGGITYDDSGKDVGLRPVHTVSMNIEHLDRSIAGVQRRIQRAWFEDLFLMLAQDDGRGQPITAREVQERHEEKLLALGPVLERTNDELLDLLVDRVYALMDRRGLIPPPPQELHGVKLRVEFISIMNAAQRLVGVVGLDRFVQSVAPLAETMPEALDRISIDNVVEDYADMLGVNPKIIRPLEEAVSIRDARAKQQQAAAAAEQAATLAKAAGAASAHPIAPDSPLDRVLAGVPQVA